MRKNRKRVLLAMGWYDYRLHVGISKYALEHNWHLCPDTTKEKVVPWGWEGDGILAWLGRGDDLADFVLHAGKPTVDFSYRRPHLHYPRVLVDHATVARLVAEHFLSRGHKNFAFYSDVNNWAFEENGRGFLAALDQAGHKGEWIRWYRSPNFTDGHLQWKQKRNWLSAELKRLPKPLALFAATDDHAVEALEICEALGLAVPDVVSIVGSDNSQPAVEAMHTPISSVDTNLELVGYRGAALLDELMTRKKAVASAEPLRIAPAGLIARKSSDLLAVNHPGLARALRFMMDHCNETMGVDDLARVASMSRRGLTQAFMEQLGRSPGHELQRVRLERAKCQLLQSNEKLQTIGENCGFKSANTFWFAFKKFTGLSPKQYRIKFARA
jgi:LacI family transcriptional regulator